MAIRGPTATEGRPAHVELLTGPRSRGGIPAPPGATRFTTGS